MTIISEGNKRDRSGIMQTLRFFLTVSLMVFNIVATRNMAALDSARRLYSERNIWIRGYVWRSNDEALALVNAKKGGHHAVKLSLRKGTTTPLSLIPVNGVLNIWVPPIWAVSPDGNWLLRFGAYQNWIATTFDGKHRLKWHAKGMEMSWMPDSIRWIEWVWHPLSGNKQDTGTMAGLIHRLDDPYHTFGTILLPPSHSALGFRRSDHLITTDNSSPAYGEPIRLFEFSLGAKAPHDPSYSIPLSKSSRVIELVLSPTGEHVAWMQVSRRVDPRDQLGRFLTPKQSAEIEMQRLTGEEELVLSIWVSKINGDDRKEVARLIMPDGTTEFLTAKWHGPTNLQWTPDYQHLSYLYNGVLWGVHIR